MILSAVLLVALLSLVACFATAAPRTFSVAPSIELELSSSSLRGRRRDLVVLLQPEDSLPNGTPVWALPFQMIWKINGRRAVEDRQGTTAEYEQLATATADWMFQVLGYESVGTLHAVQSKLVQSRWDPNAMEIREDYPHYVKVDYTVLWHEVDDPMALPSVESFLFDLVSNLQKGNDGGYDTIVLGEAIKLSGPLDGTWLFDSLQGMSFSVGFSSRQGSDVFAYVTGSEDVTNADTNPVPLPEFAFIYLVDFAITWDFSIGYGVPDRKPTDDELWGLSESLSQFLFDALTEYYRPRLDDFVISAVRVSVTENLWDENKATNPYPHRITTTVDVDFAADTDKVVPSWAQILTNLPQIMPWPDLIPWYIWTSTPTDTSIFRAAGSGRYSTIDNFEDFIGTTDQSKPPRDPNAPQAVALSKRLPMITMTYQLPMDNDPEPIQDDYDRLTMLTTDWMSDVWAQAYPTQFSKVATTLATAVQRDSSVIQVQWRFVTTMFVRLPEERLPDEQSMLTYLQDSADVNDYLQNYLQEDENSVFVDTVVVSWTSGNFTASTGTIVLAAQRQPGER